MHMHFHFQSLFFKSSILNSQTRKFVVKTNTHWSDIKFASISRCLPNLVTRYNLQLVNCSMNNFPPNSEKKGLQFEVKDSLL